MKTWLIILGIVLVVAAGAILFVESAKAPTNPAGNNATVTERGNADILRNISVHAGDSVSSPLVVTGEARGTWYFEASFPIALVDWDGKIVALVPAEAQGEWMTEAYVPFKAVLTFETPTAGDPAANRGALILQKDNPSGLSEHDDSLEIPVLFK